VVQRKQKAPTRKRKSGEGKQATQSREIRDGVKFWVFDASFEWGKRLVVLASDYDSMKEKLEKENARLSQELRMVETNSKEWEKAARLERTNLKLQLQDLKDHLYGKALRKGPT